MSQALHDSPDPLDPLLNQTEEPEAEASLRLRVKLGFLVAMLLTVFVGFLSLYNARKAAEDADWVAHTHEVSTKLELSLRHLIDVETGERGFVLTGLASFLEPYEIGKYAVIQDLQALRLLTIDNRDQQRRLDELSRQVKVRIEAAEELVTLRQKSGAIDTTRIQHAKSLMDAVRATVQEMEDEENRLLKQRIQRVHFARQFTTSAIAGGSILGLIFLSFAVVTVSREIAEELHRSRQDLEMQTIMLQSVLDSIDQGLVAADESGKFILWNAAATRIVGMGAENVTPGEWNRHYGVYLPDTITPLPDEQNPLSRAIKGEVSTAEVFIRNAELEEGAWLEIGGGPLKGRDGSARGGVVAFRDITKKKAADLEIRKLNEELEEKVQQRTAQLEAANHELQAFSYSVSHDLRAPLRHIGSFAKILSQDFSSAMDPEARRHLERIENSARRMTLLVDGLLSLARLGPQSLKLVFTELNAIVDSVISVLQPECDGRDVEWRIAQLPTVECDPILMGQVFQNLLSNALKYSSRLPKAIIEIDSIQQAGKQPIIFVRDNGAGFSMKHAGKLFGVFQRMHTDAEFEGTGVGLATVHRIIQKHRGIIWAESEPDHGATFYFTLGVNVPTKTTQKVTLEHVHE